MLKTVEEQRKFFQSGATLPYAFRVKQLKTLYGAIKKNEDLIFQALQRDLGKSPFESYATEVSLVYAEIKHTLKHLKGWMKEQRRRLRYRVSVPNPISTGNPWV